MNNKGFFHLHTVFVLSLLMMILFGIGFIGATIQTQQRVRSLCLKESLQIQNFLMRSEKKLLQMNVASSTLKTAYYAAVAASLFPPTAAVGQAQMQTIQTLRQNLDKAQKLLISSTNQIVQAKSYKLLLDLNYKTNQSQQVWSYYLSLIGGAYIVRVPTMAVHPISSDLAPNYELEPNHKQKQILEFKWHLLFLTRQKAQRFLSEQAQFSIRCGASLEKERKSNKWLIEIIADKF